MTAIMRERIVVVGAILGLCLSTSAYADWQPDASDKMQAKAYAALTKFKDKHPQMQSYFEQAHGYAIIPGITRIAVGFGLAYGKGLVMEGNELIGWTSYSQLSSGVQLGAKYFSMILFFKDGAALDDYKNYQVRFLAQAGVDLATVGISGTPAYNDGVAIFAITRFGLMVEISYSGARFKYRPVN
jgi:lipid-binding SYLF domain-containing protein